MGGYWYWLLKGEFGEMTNARTNQVIIDQSDFCTIFELERKINKMVNTHNTKSPFKIINYTVSYLNIYFLQNWFYISVKSMYQTKKYSTLTDRSGHRWLEKKPCTPFFMFFWLFAFAPQARFYQWWRSTILNIAKSAFPSTESSTSGL